MLMERSDSGPAEAARWVLLVAAEHAELFEHLRRAFSGDAKVEVVLDRRADPARTPEWVRRQLQKDGVVLLKVEPQSIAGPTTGNAPTP